MTKELKISILENRLALLESRTSRDNKNVANKIKRKLKALKAEAQNNKPLFGIKEIKRLRIYSKEDNKVFTLDF